MKTVISISLSFSLFFFFHLKIDSLPTREKIPSFLSNRLPAVAHTPYPVVIIVCHLFITVCTHLKEYLNICCLGVFEGETIGCCPWPTVPGGKVPYDYGGVVFIGGVNRGGGLCSMWHRGRGSVYEYWEYIDGYGLMI